MKASCSKPKIVLFLPKPEESIRGILPLSLLSIARMVNQQKYDVRIINATTDDDYKQRVLDYGNGALCFGISCMTGPQIRDAIDVAMTVRKNYPMVPIVWGGYHPSILPRQTAEHSCVDVVVRGQGERTLQELVHQLSNGRSLEQVDGITYKEGNNIVDNPDRPLEDINDFPPILYDMVEVKKCIQKSTHGNHTIDYVSSQGCPHDCGFCCEPKFCKRKWSGLNAERVVNDLECLVGSYDIDNFAIQDSNFFVDKKRARKIFEGIVERNLDVSLSGLNARVEVARWDDGLWELMRRAGIRELLIGAESGSQRVLDLIGKNVTVEDTLLFVDKCVKHGIDIIVSLMIGLPTMNIRDETKRTIQLIDRILKKCKDKISIGVLLFLYTPYPGSRLYNLSIDCGFRPPQNLEGWADFGLLAEYEAPWVPKKYVKLVRQLHFTVFPYLDPRELSRRLGHKEIETMFVRAMAGFRWKFKFFGLPIEYEALEIAHRLGVRRNKGDK